MQVYLQLDDLQKVVSDNKEDVKKSTLEDNINGRIHKLLPYTKRDKCESSMKALEAAFEDSGLTRASGLTT